jgi:hypothetical protein
MKLNQPKALPILFATELWERFDFYSLLSIFTVYMTTKLGMSDGDACLLFGVYTAFAYLGWELGDRAALEAACDELTATRVAFEWAANALVRGARDRDHVALGIAEWRPAERFHTQVLGLKVSDDIAFPYGAAKI